MADLGSECLSVEGAGCGCNAPAAPVCGTGTGGSAGGASDTSESADTGEIWVGSPAGCGCATVHGGVHPWILILALTWARRWVVLVGLLLLGATAHAVDVDQLPYGDGGTFIGVRDGDLGDPWLARAALTGAYLQLPLVARSVDGTTVPIVQSVTTLAVGTSLTLGPRVRLAATFPLHPLVVDGDRQVGSSMGDIDLSLGIPLTGAESRVQGSWTVQLDSTTGEELAFVGGRGAIGGIFATEAPVGDVLRFGSHLGFRLRPAEQLAGSTWGNTVEYGVGAAALGPWDTDVTLEAFGAVGLHAPTVASFPLEWLAGLRHRVGDRVAARIGGGGGLGRGLGNPQVRALAAVELFGSVARDRDADGYADVRDLCPTRPEDHDRFHDLEGCPDPDNDRDGLLDPDDACPDAPETVNGFADGDGCPDQRATLVIDVGPDDVEQAVVTIDGEPEVQVFGDEDLIVVLDPGVRRVHAEADGYLSIDTLQQLPEGRSSLRLRFVAIPQGSVGVAVVDPEGTAVVGAAVEVGDVDLEAPYGFAEVRFAPGPVDVRVTAPGFLAGEAAVVVPESGRADVTVVLSRPAVALVGRQLIAGDEIGFTIDDAAVRPSADGALDALARWLSEHPEVELLRVEGHADDIGGPRYNLDLSRRRAESVCDALVARGVARDRLEPIGTGEANQSTEDPTRRMVGFLVLVWDETD